MNHKIAEEEYDEDEDEDGDVDDDNRGNSSEGKKDSSNRTARKVEKDVNRALKTISKAVVEQIPSSYYRQIVTWLAVALAQYAGSGFFFYTRAILNNEKIGWTGKHKWDLYSHLNRRLNAGKHSNQAETLLLSKYKKLQQSKL